MKIYNMFGQELETLTRGYQTAGEHEIRWQPVKLASGIYFYRLELGSFNEARKLIFFK